MKRKSIILLGLGLTALCGLLSSCLKDKEVDEGRMGFQVNKEQKIVEIAGPTDGFVSVDLLNSNNDTTVDIVVVRLASEEPAKEDVSVTLAVDPAVVTAYNDEQHTNFQVPAANLYSFVSPTVTIPKGEREATLQLRLKTSPLSGTPYALGIKVASVSDPSVTISGNYKTQVVFLAIRNPYDGIYSVESGTVTRYTAPGVPAGDALSGSLAGNPDVALATVGATTVSPPPATGTGALQWAAGNNLTVSGIDGLRFAVDPVTNLVTVTSAGNATLSNWSGKDNRYDPATKTFYLAFRWNPTSNVREYEVVLKYKGPR
jgi:hypothetical protein